MFVTVGEVWEPVEPPTGKTLKHVSVGCYAVWGLDSAGQLLVRREITSVFPEGTHWQMITTTASDMGNYGECNNDVHNLSSDLSIKQPLITSKQGNMCMLVVFLEKWA